jgi:hypothetical protein
VVRVKSETGVGGDNGMRENLTKEKKSWMKRERERQRRERERLTVGLG